MDQDILTGTLSDAAAAIRAGRVSPVDLTEAANVEALPHSSQSPPFSSVTQGK